MGLYWKDKGEKKEGRKRNRAECWKSKRGHCRLISNSRSRIVIIRTSRNSGGGGVGRPRKTVIPIRKEKRHELILM